MLFFCLCSIVNEGEWELLTRRSGVSVQGRPTDLVFLTEKGKWVYAKLTGKPPVPGELEMLLKSHKSERHTSMILKTADHFTNLGFDVERQPVEIKIAENRYFQPDLVVRKDSEVFYLEVETGEREDRISLVHKWENAFIAGAGRMCIVAPRPWGDEHRSKYDFELGNREWQETQSLFNPS